MLEETPESTPRSSLWFTNILSSALLSLKFAAWVVKLNFLSFSQHMHITFTGNPPVRSTRQICNGICEEIQPLHLIQPPDCCQEIQTLPFNLQESQHPKIQSYFLQSLMEVALILVTEQSPDTGSSTSGAIRSGFSQCFPTQFWLMTPTILSMPSYSFGNNSVWAVCPAGCLQFHTGRISKPVKKERLLPLNTEQLINAVKLSWNWNWIDGNISALS